MKKIIFICPYFGSLSDKQIKIWAKTCKYNSEIRWLIITDCQLNMELPQNIKVIYTTLDKLREEFERKLGMKISLENGYKLCDFKPIYGYLFHDEIQGYEYWGHCDMSDCIFGDIQKYLFSVIKNKPDKIGFFGHMTLYRNTDEINKRFMLKTRSGKELSDIIGTSKNMAFDEINQYSINTIYKENNFHIERIDNLYFDITPNYKPFRCSLRDEDFKFIKFTKETYIFEWNNGKLFKICLNKGKIIKKEIGYIHYQKRKMKFFIDIDNDNAFFIVPNKFIVLDNINNNIIKQYTKDQIININYIIFKFKRLKFKIEKLLELGR